jgi:antitoxin (DNA-binding transcriptional repressor) of toxin-antitoxin stability system
MKTLTVTDARRNLTHWLKQAANGQSIGIVRGDKIVALRPVEVHAEDDALLEYGVTREQLDKFANKMDGEVAAQRKSKRLRKYSGHLEKDL